MRVPNASQQPRRRGEISGLRRSWLFHADAQPVLQLVQSPEAALLEGSVPKFVEDVPGTFAVQAELVSRVGQCLALQIHWRDRLSRAARESYGCTFEFRWPRRISIRAEGPFS